MKILTSPNGAWTTVFTCSCGAKLEAYADDLTTAAAQFFDDVWFSQEAVPVAVCPLCGNENPILDAPEGVRRTLGLSDEPARPANEFECMLNSDEYRNWYE
jgi:hypothetical protein